MSSNTSTLCWFCERPTASGVCPYEHPRFDRGRYKTAKSMEFIYEVVGESARMPNTAATT